MLRKITFVYIKVFVVKGLLHLDKKSNSLIQVDEIFEPI